MEPDGPNEEQEKKQVYSPPVLTELGALKDRTLNGNATTGGDVGSP